MKYYIDSASNLDWKFDENIYQLIIHKVIDIDIISVLKTKSQYTYLMFEDNTKLVLVDRNQL